MAPITFLHAADLHLDSPFQNTKNLPEDWKDKLKNSTWNAFNNAIELAIDTQVDFMILSGDIFDQESYSIKAHVRFYKMLKKLAPYTIHTYIIHGNHDPLQDEHAFDFLEVGNDPYVHVFPADKVTSVPFYKNGLEAVRLYGKSYGKRHIAENLLSQYIEKEEKDASETNMATNRGTNVPIKIALYHGQAGKASDANAYAPYAIEEMKQTAIQYWAMGHIHTRKILHNQVPYIVYPGNIQGRHVAELGQRGCYLVKWNDNQQADILFHSLETVRWEEIHFTVPTSTQQGLLPTISWLVDEIRTYIEQEYIQSTQKPHIIKLILKGQTSIYAELRKQGVIAIIAEELANDDMVVIDIVNQTFPVVNREQLRNQKTLLGEFLTLTDKMRTDPETFAELSVELAELYAYPAFQKVTETRPRQLGKHQWQRNKLEQDWKAWLDEVEQLGIDMFIDMDA